MTRATAMPVCDEGMGAPIICPVVTGAFALAGDRIDDWTAAGATERR